MTLIPKLPSMTLPGPRALPVIGVLGNLMRFFRDPVGTLLTLQDRHGDVASLARNNPAWVYAIGADYNRQVLSNSNQFHNYVEIPFPLPPDSSSTRFSQSLTSMNGDLHKRHRRMMMPAFAKSRIDGYRDDIVAVTEAALAEWRPGETADVAEQMIELTLRVAMRCFFGVDVSGNAKSLGHLGMEYIDRILSPATVMFPFRLPGTPYSRFLDISDRMEAEIRALIQRRRADLESGKTGDEPRDVLSIMLAAHDDDGTTFTDAELVGQAGMLFVASHETTAYTLMWTLFLLAHHPDVCADLVDELDAELGGDAPTVEAIERLPLLDRVVKESMRLLPTTPINFFRRSTAPFTIGRYELPAGSTLILSPLLTHRDPALFPEPNRFRPGRWEQLRPSLYQYLPFGAGPRLCIGAGFAAMALRLVLPMIVQRFRLSMAENTDVSTKVRGIILGAKGSMPMRLATQDRRFEAPPRVRGNIHRLVDL